MDTPTQSPPFLPEEKLLPPPFLRGIDFDWEEVDKIMRESQTDSVIIPGDRALEQDA